MLLAEDAAAQLVCLGAALTAIRNGIPSNAAGRRVGIGIGISVVGRLVHVLRGAAVSTAVKTLQSRPGRLLPTAHHFVGMMVGRIGH